MATANSNNQQQADPLDLALAAIDEFDRSQLPPGSSLRISAEGRDLYRRAMLRVAFAQVAELRQQTTYLNSIESWLISIDSRLEGMQEADDGAA